MDAMNRVLTVAFDAVSTEEFAELYALAYLTVQGEIVAWRDRITDDAFRDACSNLSFVTLRMFMLPAVVHAQSKLGNEAFTGDATALMNLFDAGSTCHAAYMLVRYMERIPTDADMRLPHAVRQVILNARMCHNACSPALVKAVENTVRGLGLVPEMTFDELCEYLYQTYCNDLQRRRNK